MSGTIQRHTGQHTQTGETQTMTYAVILERTGNGWSAFIPDLPGCVAAGRTEAKTRCLIKTAARLHLDALIAQGMCPHWPTTKCSRVTVRADDRVAINATAS